MPSQWLAVIGQKKAAPRNTSRMDALVLSPTSTLRLRHCVVSIDKEDSAVVQCPKSDTIPFAELYVSGEHSLAPTDPRTGH